LLLRTIWLIKKLYLSNSPLRRDPTDFFTISSTTSRIKFTIPVAFGYIEKNIKKRTEERCD